MPASETYTGVPVVPGEEEKKETRQAFDMDEAQQQRAKYVSWRLSLMKQEKDKYIQSKKCALMLYDGVFRLSGDPTGPFQKEEIVSPLARTFVEAKTAVEVRASSVFEFFPVEEEDDAWRAELLMDVVEHVRRVTKAKSKRHELKRMKNIVGSSVKWKGFRATNVKMNITKATDENGNPTEWEEKEVPGQQEIFEDVVDIIRDFLIDPNASTMDDALDCALYFRMSHEEGEETFGSNPLFHFDGMSMGSDGMIEGVMYFKKPSGKPDMLCIYCWPSAGFGVEGMKPGFCKEVYYGGLPDEHKMLPFVSYHNVPSFTQGFFAGFTRSGSGEPATSSGSVNSRQKFWAYKGDPEVIMALVELDTSFGRSLYKACDLASRSIVTTEGSFRLDTSKDWQHGEQVVGGKGKLEAITFGVANLAAFETVIENIYQKCIQAIGVDPRNLTDTKQKTLGETIAQRETSMERLQEVISFNEENGELRDGEITFKLIQQHYDRPKTIRLTGAETEDQLAKFDEVEGEHPRTGKPLFGKQYRRIRTRKPMKEMKHAQKNMLKAEDSGTYSFLSRPEYIRTSEMDIGTRTTRMAGELRALAAAQASEGITMYAGVLPLAQPGPMGEPPLLSNEIKTKIADAMEALIDKHIDSMGISGKKRVKGGANEKIEKVKDVMKMRRTSIKPLAPPMTSPVSIPIEAE